MPNPMFETPGRNSPGGIFKPLTQVKQAMGSNPQALFDKMYETNPQFRDFANSMRGKDPEQAFRENGFDFGAISRFFR